MTNDKVLSVGCNYPASALFSRDGISDTPIAATEDDMMRVFAEFPTDCTRLFAAAERDTVTHVKMMDLQALPFWVKGRLVLIGDAAHPMPPYQGQGRSMALEDALALGVVLESDTQGSEIHERLRLFERVRYARATLVQGKSKELGPRHEGEADLNGMQLAPC
jgi:2-polyprenyl-6-methoxyphenol hydroxylase-like FAD-dependent oxidoreductase